MERLLEKSGASVPRLMSDLFGKGYLCSRARENRLQLPKSLKKQPLQKRQY